MTQRLFLVAPAALGAGRVGDTVLVDGPEGRHAASVVRLSAGEHVLLGDGAGRRALAEVVACHRAAVTARILAVESQPPPDPRFVLVQALARSGRDEQAVEAATEIGVDAVVPWAAERCVVRWRSQDKAAAGQRRWVAIATAATKQSRRLHLPEVAGLAGQADVEALLREATLGLVLHEGAGMPLGSVALPPSGSVVLVVGPEGGIAPGELTAFESAGGIPVRLGRDVLRSSTAGPAALAVLSARSRWA